MVKTSYTSKKYCTAVTRINLHVTTICFDFSQQLKTDQISVQLPDDCPSDMKQVVAPI